MKHILITGLMVLLLGLAACTSAQQTVDTTYTEPAAGSHGALGQAQEGLAKGNTPPDFSVTTVDGDTLRLSDYTASDRPVLVYFFATWCPYCREDFNALSTLFEEYQNDVEFVAMTLDAKESRDKIASYQKEYDGLDAVAFATADVSVLSDYNVRHTTTKYAVGRDGTLIYIGSGPLSPDQWRVLLDALIES